MMHTLHLQRTVNKKILDHLGVCEENKNQRAPPLPKIDYTERVEIVLSDDARSLTFTWPEYEEGYLNVKKVIHPSMDMSVQNQQEEGREDTFPPEYVEQHL